MTTKPSPEEIIAGFGPIGSLYPWSYLGAQCAKQLVKALTDASYVIVDREPTREQLQAIHDGPLGADDHVMDEKTEAWLREMYRAMTQQDTTP